MILSRSDLLVTLEVINQCLKTNGQEDLLGLIDLIKRNFDIKGTLFAYQEKFNLNDFSTAEVSAVDIDQEWLQLYKNKEFALVDPILQYSFKVDSAILWSNTYSQYSNSGGFRDLASEFDLVEGMTYSTTANSRNGAATVISICYGSPSISLNEQIMLQQILPHLHEALNKPALWSKPKLTAKEREVISWAKDGKSYWETGQIMGVSERTIKFHLQNIYRKLDVTNRSQAVAKAMRIGLIEH